MLIYRRMFLGLCLKFSSENIAKISEKIKQRTDSAVNSLSGPCNHSFGLSMVRVDCLSKFIYGRSTFNQKSIFMSGFLRIGFAMLVVGAFSGCASLTTSNENQVRVEAVDVAGVEVKDAKCEMLRGDLRSEFKTPAVIPLKKDSTSVMIACTKEGQPEGKGLLISRVGAATFGNILLGGVIGAAVDQATGKAYNFPEWIQITLGKILTFDRKEHVADKVSKGSEMTTEDKDTASKVAAKTPEKK